MRIILPILVFCLLLAVLKTLLLAGAIAAGLTILAGAIFRPAQTFAALSIFFVMFLISQQPVLLAVFMVVAIVGKIIEIMRGD